MSASFSRVTTPARLILFSILLTIFNTTAIAEFVGSAHCASCHQIQYQSWLGSDHAKAMSVADANTVLGDFNDTRVTFHSIDSRFFRKGDAYFIETLGEDNKTHQYAIAYTFGHYPLQQYLVETDNGHIQALNIAWDSRPAGVGGQRWFHLQPNEPITPSSPFFWSKHLQNWNSRCAQCHSTNVDKHYDPTSATYATEWSEINVGCEACHGAGGEHVQRANDGNLASGSGLVNAPATLRWHFKKGEAIASPVGEKSNSQINMCGGCHSRRSVIGELNANANYHDQYQLSLLEPGMYYPDGQIQDEVFVLGSFLQSKMHQRGVNCNNCHDPHGGQTILAGNRLCTQCHKPDAFDTPAHHFHPDGSSGAQCVACHMPARTYMQVDDRRDHKFVIPSPKTSKKLGTPNACNDCHKGSTPDWAINTMAKWLRHPAVENRLAVIGDQASRGDPTTTRDIVAIANDDSISAIMRATRLAQLSAFPSRLSVKTAAEQLNNPDPLLRVAAIRSLQGVPANQRWKLLAALIVDPVKVVRMAVANSLSTMMANVPPEKIEAVSTLLQEYRASLRLSLDMPATMTTLGNLELNLGNINAAKSNFMSALEIEPHYIPALLNLADLYRISGEESKAQQLLKKALGFAPDSGAANYSYGLSLIRNRRYEDALPYLLAATEQADSTSQYAYVYAIALDSVSRTSDAVTFLQGASQKWPNQYSLLITQVHYLEKLHRLDEVLVPLATLSLIAPNAPEVRSRLQQYRKLEN